ncbi:hypothetical protein ACEQ8H_005634 [Pleosporales sp. CAS-2024a]
MAAPNEPPRRVSMAYILGFSNKPFKDPKPPPAPRPRQSAGLGELLSSPIGLVEWAASDGRKCRLSGQGQARSRGEKKAKASSEKGDKDVKESNKENQKPKEDPGDTADDENPHGFTKEEDERMLEWKAANDNKPWLVFAEEIGKTVEQCKERFRRIRPKDGNQNANKEQGSKDGGGGGKGGGNHAQQNSQKMSKREKKEAKQNKGAGNGQNHQGKNDKKDAGSGGAVGSSEKDTSGDNDDIWGAFLENGPADVDDKKSTTSKRSKKGDADANDGWDQCCSGGDGDKKSGGSKQDDTGNNNDAWNQDQNNQPWNQDQNNDPWNQDDKAEKTNNGGGWAADTGGAADTSSPNAESKNESSPAWQGNGIDGANDTAWDTTGNDQADKNSNKNGGGFGTCDWNHNTAKSASKANSHRSSHGHSDKHSHGRSRKSSHSHKSRSSSKKEGTKEAAEIELKPDSTFSADDLKLVARILQQDYQMVWSRVSWRFKDKTGRTVPAEVFEKKITGRVQAEEKEGRK